MIKVLGNWVRTSVENLEAMKIDAHTTESKR